MNRKWGILVAMGMVVITSLACDGNGNDETVTATPSPSPAQRKQMIMDNAHANGETVFMFNAEQTTQHALFSGGERIVYVKSRILRTVKLTSNECLNLEIRKRVNDDWVFVYAFQNIGIGDYAFYDGSSWRVTTYNPTNTIVTGG